MFECKLICTDIDGTLLDPNHRISERTKEAIVKAHRKGIIIALVSGRIASSLTIIQQELGISGPLGCFNGALVLDEDRKELEAHPIRCDQLSEVLLHLSKTEMEYFVFTNEHWYMNEKNAWYEVEVEASRTQGIIQDLGGLYDTFSGNERPFKILAMHEDSSYKEAQEAILQEQFGSSLNIFSSSPRYIEILARGVDKGHAVRSLCESYCVHPGNVMAVGDYFNDLGMFRSAGYAVAMGNAPDAVKNHAHALTSSNQEDGLALAIEAIL
ncbi:MAG: Cof-type HAD-IIB family hydrolase [Sphaerochaeta sp.]